MFAVYSEIYKKYINPLCVQNVEFSYCYGYVKTLVFKRLKSVFLHYYLIYILFSHVKKNA